MASSLFVKKIVVNSDISVFNHVVLFFAQYVRNNIKGDCNHSENNFKNVSGTIFRSSIEKKYL